MSTKRIIYLMVFIGSLAGGYLPELWGANLLSGQSFILGFLGALVGVFVGFKLARAIGAE